MKTTLLRSWKLVTAVAGLALLAGGFRGPGSTASAGEEGPGDDPSAAAPANTNSTNAAPPAPDAPSAATVKLAPTAAEIVRLAESGLGEGVMLAFTANSTGTFNLGSEQIIYLNDLGVPATVITAMIQHDLALKAGPAENTLPVPDASISADNNLPAIVAAPATGLEAYSPDYTNYDLGDYAGPDNYVPPDDSPDYFYDSLAPYGNWIYIAGFGRCWQPTVVVVNHDWRPYFDRGRWLNSDSGWCWQSDYSWGWAAFHYGRWFDDGRHGWVWRPDREWGPAWVSWRQSAEYCGWAPLPPSARFVPGVGFRLGSHAVAAGFEFGLRPGLYTFIPVERLADYAPYRYQVTPWQLENVHAGTTVINHVTFENNRAVYQSVDPHYVAEVSHAEVRKVVVRAAPAGGSGNLKLEHLEKIGDTLVLVRPQLPPPAKVAARQIPAPDRPGTPASGVMKPVAATTIPPSQHQPIANAPEPSAQAPERPRRLPNMNLANHPAPAAAAYYPAQAKASASPDAVAGQAGIRILPGGGWQLFQSPRPPGDLDVQPSRAPLPWRDPLVPVPALKPQPGDLDPAAPGTARPGPPQFQAFGSVPQHYQPNADAFPSATAPVRPPEPAFHAPAAEPHPVPVAAPVAHASAPTPPPASSSSQASSSTKK